MSRTRLAFLLAVSLAVPLAGCGGSKAAPATTTPAAPAPPAAVAEPTTADDVIERSLAAQGGRPALAKFTSMKQTGTLVIPQMGAKGTMMLQAVPPRSSVMQLEIPGIGKIAQGVKDDVAWEMNPMTGARIVTGAERTLLLREATFGADLMWKELYPTSVLDGVVDFQGTPAYKVTLTAKEGDTQTRYFAKDTFLPLGVEMTVDSQMGKVPMTMKLSDHREIAGVKFAHKMERNEGQVTIEITIDKIEPNVAIPATTFDLPPEIQKLQKK
ncbi:MAG: hypothetical protein M3680_32645 [Myxococcota bacterium]|nr:hypothetical protein [Myxococcota bacterium]